MKVYFLKKSVLFLLLSVAAVSCNKNSIESVATATNDSKTITISVTSPCNYANDTKVTYIDENVGTSKPTITWESGDKVVLVGINSNNEYVGQSELVLTNGAGSSNGTFRGERIEGAVKYYLYYPSDVAVSQIDGKASIPLLIQTQTGLNNVDHLKKSIFFGTNDYIGNLNRSFSLNIINSLLKINVKNVPADLGDLKSMIVYYESPVGRNVVSLNFNNYTNSKDSIFYISFSPDKMPLKSGGRFCAILNGNKSYKFDAFSESGLNCESGRRYNVVFDKFVEVEKQTAAAYRFGYDNIGAEDRKVYDHIVEALINTDAHVDHSVTYQKKAVFDFASIGKPELDRYTSVTYIQDIVNKILGDMPEMYIVASEVPRQERSSSKTFIRVSKEYSNNYKTIIPIIRERANEICKGARGLKTDYEKVKYIHDKFLPITYSIQNSNRDNILGGLVDDKVLCEGFAHTFQYLCQNIGIKCIYIEGVAKSMNGLHAWNYVYIDNAWYLLDATVDNGMVGNTVAGYKAFLLGKNSVVGDYDLFYNVYPNLPELSATDHPLGKLLRK